MKYEITLTACDDWTVVTLDVTPDELAALWRLQEAVNAESSYNCMPTMKLKPAES